NKGSKTMTNRHDEWPFLGKSISRRSVLAIGAGAVATTALAGVCTAWAQNGAIKVGALMPLSGAGGSFGQEMLAAARAALEEINAAGGPLGREIVLIEENGETNPEAAVRGARKL